MKKALDFITASDQTAKGRDRLGSSSEIDLPSGENGITKSAHRLVKEVGM
jgi:hypothetical protein